MVESKPELAKRGDVLDATALDLDLVTQPRIPRGLRPRG
jgi:hypothetical protein